MLLRKRAEEIIELVQKAEDEISLSEETIAGDITIGAGETDGVRFLTKAAQAVQKDYPLVHFHIISGDKVTVTESMDKGLIDFGLFFGEIDTAKYEYIHLPYKDTWGVLMRRDSLLAKKEIISPEDLQDKPLIISRQALHDSELQGFLQCKTDKLNIVGTYNLLFNGSLMAADGMGYALCLDNIINVSGNSSLCFKPFSPKLEAEMSIAWKKYQVLTKATQKFLQKLQETI